MDAEKFVQNVKNICIMREVPPTIACRESGAGKNLLSEVARGIVPSVNKVQALAQYLGVTTSELLGETGTATQVLDERYAPFIDLFAELDPAEQTKVVGDMLRRKNKK